MSRPKVIVIDPIRELRELLAERLKTDGMDVDHAETGSYGLKLIKERMPDLVILELDLADIGGFYVLEKIRTTESLCHIPVVVLTKRNEPETEERAYEYGANGFFTKPYRPASFFENVKDLATHPLDKEAIKLHHPTRTTERLVTERLEVELRTETHLLRGLTTGINEFGLGAQVNDLELLGDGNEPLEKGPCEITFISPKYPILPCSGSILRVEESRDPNYQKFLAVEISQEGVGAMSEGDKQSLNDWIQSQLETSEES